MYLLAAEGRDEAGAVVYWRRRGPSREVVIPPFTQYSPVWIRSAPSEAAVHSRRSAFEALLTALAVDFAQLRFFIAIPDIRPAQWQGWRVNPLYTYRLSLVEDDLMGRWSSATRRTYRKHEGAYRVEEQPGAASAIIQHCTESYGRHGRSLPATPSRVQALVDTLQAVEHVRLFTATPINDQTPEGGLAVLHDGQTAHYWIAGSTPGPAMTVLLGHTLPRLRDAGIEVFDFVGANTPSIAEFKRHFGPVLTPYFHLEKITRPELRLLHRLRGR